MNHNLAQATAREVVAALLAACDARGPIAPGYADTIVAPLIKKALDTPRAGPTPPCPNCEEVWPAQMADLRADLKDAERCSNIAAARATAAEGALFRVNEILEGDEWDTTRDDALRFNLLVESDAAVAAWLAARGRPGDGAEA